MEKISAEMGFRTPNQLLEAILREQFLAPRFGVNPGVYPTWQNVSLQTEPVLSPISEKQQISWSPGRDLNPRPAAYKAAAITAKLPGPLIKSKFNLVKIYYYFFLLLFLFKEVLVFLLGCLR